MEMKHILKGYALGETRRDTLFEKMQADSQRETMPGAYAVARISKRMKA
jgi:hypothetical protein